MSKALFVIKNYTNEMTCTCSNICMFPPLSNSNIIGGVSFDRIKRDYLIDYLRDFNQLVCFHQIHYNTASKSCLFFIQGVFPLPF